MLRRLVPTTLLVAAITATAVTATASANGFEALAPGDNPAELVEAVDVNVLLVGIEPDEAAWDEIEAGLPETGAPVIRSKDWYGLPNELGISYSYSYQPVYADEVFEQDFFAFLAQQAVDQPLTLFQQDYNAQLGNALDVTDNAWIDAVTVERWLAQNAPVDTTRPTVVLADWYGLDGFRFHVYTKTDVADPDTGYNFGLLRNSRKMSAWGGTTADDLGTTDARRIWFYDMSAGPEGWTGNWNVDDADLDGDGEPDYRLPPSWEYGAYRTADALAGDLAKVIRYVAVNLLFTSSPLYPPYHEANTLPQTVELDMQIASSWKKKPLSQLIKPSLLLAETQQLPTGATYSISTQRVAWSGETSSCYLQWVRNVRCYPDRSNYPAYANLFLYGATTPSRWEDGSADYEVGMFSYVAGARPKGAQGLLGFSDDNWFDGTQSGVFSFTDPSTYRDFGYGLTTTGIHEHGHHAGLSHPHDGYDPQSGVDYGPTGEFQYAWLGDMSATIMSYMDLSTGFSQFDLDNTARHRAAGYWRVTNRVAADVQAAGGDLTAVDAALVEAQRAMADHDYPGTLAYARQAYDLALATADTAGVAAEQVEDGWYLPDRVKGKVGVKPRKDVVDADPAYVAQRYLP